MLKKQMIEAACKRLGVVSPDSLPSSGQTVNLGYSLLADTPSLLTDMAEKHVQAVEKIVFTTEVPDKVRGLLHSKLCFTFRDYLFYCREAEKPWDKRDGQHYASGAFFQRYTRNKYTPDEKGYWRYLQDQAPNFTEFAEREQVPVVVSENERMRHTYIAGSSGSGKSELIKLLVHASVTDKAMGSVVIIDPHGDLCDEVAAFKDFVDQDRLVFFKPDLSASKAPCFNPFVLPDNDKATKVLFTNTITAGLKEALDHLDAGISPQAEGVLSHCISVLLEMGNASLYDLYRFLDDDVNEAYIERGKRHPNPITADFFSRRFVEDGLLRPTKKAALNKLDLLLQNETFRHVVTGSNSLNLAKEMDAGKIIVISAKQDLLTPAGCAMFGRLVISYLVAVAMMRQRIPRDKRVPCHIFVDECDRFVGRSVERILKETRKYKVYLTLAQQDVGYDMSPQTRKAVLNNTNIKFVGRANEVGEAGRSLRLLGRDVATENDIMKVKNGLFYVKVGESDAFKMQAHGHLVGDKHSMTASQKATEHAKQVALYYSAPNEQNHTETATNAPEGHKVGSDLV